MKKEDLLKKYRCENVDEGMDHTDRLGEEYGFLAIIALTTILTVYKSYNNIPYGDVASLPLAYLAFWSFRRYKDTKTRDVLIYGIISSSLCLAFLVWYMVQTI